MHILPPFLLGSRFRVACGLAVLCLGLAPIAWAGGGPENVLLVVNSDSPASLAIANHYAALRRIPSSNILYLTWDPKVETTDIDTFRQRILVPVLQAVGRGHAPGQINCVAYSSDFPWAIQLDADVKRLEATIVKEAAEKEEKARAVKKEKTDKGGKGDDGPRQKSEIAKPERKPDPSVPRLKWPTHLTKTGSLTGLTYLYEGVMTRHPLAYMQLQSNQYMRRPVPEQKGAPTLGFEASDSFGPLGELAKLPDDGRHYLLSTMLGVTAGRGNSLDEVLGYLRRSAAADGTHPAGTIYYVQNGDIRSRVRQRQFAEAVKELEALGVAAKILNGVTPIAKGDVQGAMLGTAEFNWTDSRSTILPGAICEHFTSFGGVMSSGGGQTPLSEFLRHGAAGASGTVTEPYAIAEKFPTAMIHVHYARGCTLAEAFYQSVSGPYQLLIVGDPLCRPWANIPKVTVSGVEPGKEVKGVVRLQPAAEFPGKSTGDRFRLFLDGMLIQDCRPGGSFEVDTTKLADGYHEFRVVAAEAGLIRSQGQVILPVTLANQGRKIKVDSSAKTTLASDQALVITAQAPGCVGMGVAQGTRWVGRVVGPKGRFEIKASQLGAGPVRLQVMGVGDAQSPGNVLSKPLELTVGGKEKG